MGTHESKKVTHLVWLWVRRILLGLLVLLVATEIALRTLSTWNPFRLPDPPPKGDEELTVLCVGDSFTYGMGAPRGESYPDHLQEMLRPTVRVVNRGWPGANSALMAAYLPAWLAEEEPDLVLVMAGINNKHNPLGGTYQALVDAGYHVPAFGETAKRRLDELLWRFRSYRMLRWQLRGEEFGEVEALARDADPAEVYSYFLRRQAYGYREWNRLFYKGAGANELPAGIEEGASAETIQAALPAIVTALTAVEDADDLTEWHHNLYHATRRTLAPREAERFVGELRALLGLQLRGLLDDVWGRALPDDAAVPPLDDAFVEAYETLAARARHRGDYDRAHALQEADPFSEPAEWLRVLRLSKRVLERHELAALITPTDAAPALATLDYGAMGTNELVDEVRGWVRRHLGTRGRAWSEEDVSAAVLLWVEPGSAIRRPWRASLDRMLADRAVSRALRYVALRRRTALANPNHGADQ